MAFPTTGILDDFSPNDTHPMTGWFDFVNGIDAVSGLGKGSTINDVSVSCWDTAYGPLVSPGAEAYITISTKPVDTNAISIYLLTNTTEVDGYYLYYLAVAAGNDTVQINRVDDNTYTQLGSTISQEFANGDKLGLEIIGNSNNIKAYRCPSGGSWAQLGSTQSDNTYCGAGVTAKPTIAIDDDASLVSAIDDFGGGTVVSSNPSMTISETLSFAEALD
jgi:hypothetical protein